MNAGMFSSETCEWATPQAFFDEVQKRLGPFDLDVCATEANAKAPRFFTKEIDGLAQTWTGTCWMNPPYGREIGKWIKKAFEASQDHGATVVCLIPSRTDTRWWHSYVMKGTVEFIKGRLRFGDATQCAPFPSALVVFTPPPKDESK